MRNADDQLAAAAARQHRILSRTQAIAVLGTDAVDRHLRTGYFGRLGVGAYYFRGAAPDWLGLCQAALFDAGEEAAISHGAAARLHHYPGYFDAAPEILVPRALDHRCEIAAVHESRRFHRIPFTIVDGLRVTTPEATLVLLAGGMRAGRLSWLVDELVSGAKLRLPELERVRQEVCGRGVPGSALLKAVLTERQPGDPVPESRLERMFLKMCDRYGIPRPAWQCAIPGEEHTPGRVDGIFRDQRLIVEVDGRRWHTRVADFERDHRRDLRAAAMGYRVARITHLMLTHEPWHVAAELRSALRRSAA